MKKIKKLLKAQDYYGILEYLFEIEDETLLKNSIEYLKKQEAFIDHRGEKFYDKYLS